MTIKKMSTVINLIGTVSSPLICFVYPSLFYIICIKDITPVKKWVLIIFMIGFMSLFSLFGLIHFIYI